MVLLKVKKRYDMKENTKLTLAIIVTEIMMVIGIVSFYLVAVKSEMSNADTTFGYILVMAGFINVTALISYYFYRKEKK